MPSGLPEKDKARKVVENRKRTLTGTKQAPSAEAKKALTAWTLEQGEQGLGKVSPETYWAHVADSTCYTAIQVKQWLKPDHQRRLDLWLQGQAALRQRRSCSRWLRFKSTDTGCRMGKNGEKKKTRPDLFAVFYPGLRQWCLEQRCAGWELSGDDLLDEYNDLCESEVWRLEDLELVSPLAKENLKWLEALRSRLASMQKRDSYKKVKARVKCLTGFTEQAPGLVSPLLPDEVDCILALTWQSWDYKVNLMYTGSAEDIKHEVIDSEAWIEARDRVAMVFWDAVPVYLDPSVGRLLVDMNDLMDLRKREEARRMKSRGLGPQQLPGCVRVRPKGDAMGATRRDKNRVTVVLRQVIKEHYNLPPGQLPVGEHLPSLLIVPVSQPCFLDDMSRGAEPAVWLRSHDIVLDGKPVHREAGEPVGPLMAPWRETRRLFPELFEGKVLVVGLDRVGRARTALVGAWLGSCSSKRAPGPAPARPRPGPRPRHRRDRLDLGRHETLCLICPCPTVPIRSLGFLCLMDSPTQTRRNC